jgi:hypothetical protein
MCIFYIISTVFAYTTAQDNNTQLVYEIICIVFISLALIIKIGDCIFKKLKKSALKAFFSFYFGFLLTVFQLIFFYDSTTSLEPAGSDNTLLNMYVYFIIARNTLFSLILNVHTASYL